MQTSADCCGIITLLTDFGLQDPFVGVMKGVILGRLPTARIVDLTHGILPQDLAAASYWLSRSFEWFPPGTVHVAVVDPGVGSDRAAIALRAENHLLLGPDNGILDSVREGHHPVEVREIDLGKVGLPAPSNTFHGRDLFAPVAAELAAGRLRFVDVGPVRTEVESLPATRLRRTAAGIEGAVVTIDRFGNLVTNIDERLVSGCSKVQVRIGGRTIPLRRTYADGSEGELVALVNSFGSVEIACRNGSAASALGAQRGALVVVEGV